MTLKQSFAGAVACVALMSAAHAADLQPVLKAPAAVEQQATDRAGATLDIISPLANPTSPLMFGAGPAPSP